MKERATKFDQAKRSIKENTWDKNFNLTIRGFRLIKETTCSIEEKI
jgi:hypothetical protein